MKARGETECSYAIIQSPTDREQPTKLPIRTKMSDQSNKIFAPTVRSIEQSRDGNR